VLIFCGPAAGIELTGVRRNLHENIAFLPWDVIIIITQEKERNAYGIKNSR
jgi:hypothetical protein